MAKEDRFSIAEICHEALLQELLLYSISFLALLKSPQNTIIFFFFFNIQGN